MKQNIQTIGVIGAGRFGTFYAQGILPKIFPNAKILISSNSKKGKQFASFETVCSSDIVIPAVPIGAMSPLLMKIAEHLKPGAVVMDVCSVKSYPIKWMLQYLHHSTKIIASHPMFGPSSYVQANKDLSKLVLVMHPVRIDKNLYEHIHDIFSTHLKVIEMDPKTHDKKAAKFQFTSHLIGKILHTLMMRRSSIDTKSSSLMFDLMDVLHSDSDELFLDIYRFNPYAKKQLDKISKSFQKVTSLLKSL